MLAVYWPFAGRLLTVGGAGSLAVLVNARKERNGNPTALRRPVSDVGCVSFSSGALSNEHREHRGPGGVAGHWSLHWGCGEEIWGRDKLAYRIPMRYRAIASVFFTA